MQYHWSIARVSPLLETGFDFGGMLFDVFYCDCHSASLFRSVVTFAIFWGMVIIKRGPLGITAGTGILSFVVIWKHLVKYQMSVWKLHFQADRRKYEYREYNI